MNYKKLSSLLHCSWIVTTSILASVFCAGAFAQTAALECSGEGYKVSLFNKSRKIGFATLSADGVDHQLGCTFTGIGPVIPPNTPIKFPVANCSDGIADGGYSLHFVHLIAEESPGVVTEGRFQVEVTKKDFVKNQTVTLDCGAEGETPTESR